MEIIPSRLEDWEKTRNISSIECLTIIIPPGKIEIDSEKWDSLKKPFVSTFSSGKALGKLTYVYVTNEGKKFETSLVTLSRQYDARPYFPGMNFKSVRIEALPTKRCLLGKDPKKDQPKFLELSETTKDVELHDIYGSKMRFDISERGCSLSEIRITGIDSLARIGFGGKGSEALRSRIEGKEQSLTVTMKGKSISIDVSSLLDSNQAPEGGDDATEGEEWFLDLSSLFSGYVKPDPPIVYQKGKKKSKSSCCCGDLD